MGIGNQGEIDWNEQWVARDGDGIRDQNVSLWKRPREFRLKIRDDRNKLQLGLWTHYIQT